MRFLVLAGILFAGLLNCSHAEADAPAPRLAMLARGINITHWFRFVPNRNANAMANDLTDSALAALKQSGFTYVRLAVGPEEVMDGQQIAPDMHAALTSAIGRIERAGLAVMVEPHPELLQNWNLQRDPQARRKLLGFWHDLAGSLHRFPASLTFPELVNEPNVKDPAQWDILQRQLLTEIRKALPDNTVILTGTDWSSINGLLRVQPVADRNVVYSFHSYEPQLLTLLGFWDPSINKNQFAAYLPFPASVSTTCDAEVAGIKDPHTLGMAHYWCSLHQDTQSISKNLAKAVEWGRSHGVSVAMTEFGATSQLNAKARFSYLSAVRHSAEQLDLPWAIWGLDDQMGLSLSPQEFNATRKISPQMTRALGLGPHHTS